MINNTLDLLRSKLKVQVLSKLSEEDLTPVMLAKLLKRPRASVSRTVLELNGEGLVKCISPERDRWRFYHITKLGKDSLQSIKRFM